MSDIVKLIIEIPKKTVEHIRSDYGHGCKGMYDDDRETIVDAIYNATPLDSVKAEIETNLSWEMFDEYGNETGLHKELMNILDNIGKAESEEQNDRGRT